MEEKKEIQIELSAEVAEGIYSNLSIISHAPSEFVIDFIRMTPGAPKAPVKSRIILTAEHAKRLLFALQDNIRKYEAQFGPIQRTILNGAVCLLSWLPAGKPDNRQETNSL